MQVKNMMTEVVRTIAVNAPVREAAQLMREADIGAVPVIDEHNEMVGLVTDRDLVIRAVADERDVDRTPVREVMTRGVVTVPADASQEEAVRAMKANQIRRVIAVDEKGRAIGMLSLGDLATGPGVEATQKADVLEHVCAGC